AVEELVVDGDPSMFAGELVTAAIKELRQRRFITDRPKSRTRKVELSDEGRRELRRILVVAKTPTWTMIRNKHLPTIGLRTWPVLADALGAADDAEGSGVAALRAQLESLRSEALDKLGDALLARAIGLPPGPATITRVRAHL